MTGHEQIRQALTDWLACETTDDEAENCAAAWRVATWLLTRLPGVGADVFLRSLPDDLFHGLLGHALDFGEWSDLNDFTTWPAQFFFLVYILARNERGREASRDELRTSVTALADSTIVESLRRDGRYSYVEEYELISGRAPRRIRTKSGGEAGH